MVAGHKPMFLSSIGGIGLSLAAASLLTEREIMLQKVYNPQQHDDHVRTYDEWLSIEQARKAYLARLAAQTEKDKLVISAAELKRARKQAKRLQHKG